MYTNFIKLFIEMKWYVAKIKRKKEYQIEELLKKENCECFLPSVPYNGESSKETPLFPGYIFLKLYPESLLNTLPHKIPGLLGVVSFSGFTPSVPEEEVERIRKKVKEIRNFKPTLKEGEEVRVFLDSNSIELKGVVLDFKIPEERVQVLMEFLGRYVRAVVPYSKVQPAEGIANKQKFPRRTRGKKRYLKGFGPRAFEN